MVFPTWCGWLSWHPSQTINPSINKWPNTDFSEEVFWTEGKTTSRKTLTSPVAHRDLTLDNMTWCEFSRTPKAGGDQQERSGCQKKVFTFPQWKTNAKLNPQKTQKGESKWEGEEAAGAAETEGWLHTQSWRGSKMFKKLGSCHGPAGSSYPSGVEWKNNQYLIAAVLMSKAEVTGYSYTLQSPCSLCLRKEREREKKELELPNRMIAKHKSAANPNTTASNSHSVAALPICGGLLSGFWSKLNWIRLACK